MCFQRGEVFEKEFTQLLTLTWVLVYCDMIVSAEEKSEKKNATDNFFSQVCRV